MELLPLVCLCLLSWSGTTSADHHERVVVKQDDDAVLNCSFNGVNFETGVFDWKRDEDQKNVFLYETGKHYNNGRTGQDEQFKGRVSHFQDELKHGNASIKIKKTTMADKGNYTCKFPNNYPSPTFHIELVVGAAPEPYITLHETKNESLLQCKAHGVPDLEVHWQDSDGNKLLAEEPQVTNRGGLVYITLKTTVTKTDNFSCVATQKNLSYRISSQIYVRLPVVVEEGSDVILPCSFDVNIGGERLEWKKDGQMVLVYNGSILSDNDLKQHDDRFSLFKDKLKRGNASLKIRNTKVADRGDYTCDAPQLKSSQVVHVKLFVGGELKDRTGENITGAAPEPYITLHQTKNEALLQCKAHGVPNLEVQWKDSAGKILHSKEQRVTGSNRIDITLNTTVTKGGTFYCVATQENLSHRISSEVYVSLPEDKPQPVNAGLVFGTIFGTLVVVAVILAVLVIKGCIKLNCKKGKKQPEEEPMTQPNPGKQIDPEAEALKSVKSE